MLRGFRVRGGPALWWTAILLAALGLKYHYSGATVQDLAWVLRPLAKLLEWLSGFSFHQDSNHEWLSSAANIRLVKGCAGINFMVMSLLGYGWAFRPKECCSRECRPDDCRDNRCRANHCGLNNCRLDSHQKAALFWQIAGQSLLFFTALVAAWATALVANSLRIVLAMTAANQGWDLWIPRLDDGQLHRLIGMLVYVPLLSLQMLLGDRITKTRSNAALVAPVLLYPLLTVLVPLLTGNAPQDMAAFFEHVGFVAGMSFIFGALLFCKQLGKPLCKLRGKRLQPASWLRLGDDTNMRL